MRDEFTCKEHILWFMMTNAISLSHYDHKFISNMQVFTHEKKQITSNQSALFNKLLGKYTKQLIKCKKDPVELVKLPWKCEVISSLPQYTNANVAYDSENNLLTVRAPFKRQFLQYQQGKKGNPWLWNPTKKRYEAVPDTRALRVAYDHLPKFFNTVYHDGLNDLIAEMEKEKQQFNRPTLTIINGEYVVAVSNKILDEKLEGIELNATPQCLYQMSLLGISVDSIILQNDPKLLFASKYANECDVDDLDKILSWIAELGCRYLSHQYSMGGEIGGEVRRALEKAGIALIPPGPKFDKIAKKKCNNTLPMLCQFTSTINSDQHHGAGAVGKIIVIKNGRAIKIL